jgi:hypothetical protein
MRPIKPGQMMTWGKLFSRAHHVREHKDPRKQLGVQGEGPGPLHMLWVLPNRLSQAGNIILLEPLPKPKFIFTEIATTPVRP